ncbi:MAG: hypothetical protein ABL971_07210 [Vicinamibacterales bacterium]
MVSTAERARVQAQKDALVLESHLNRLTVRANLSQVWPGTVVTGGAKAGWHPPAQLLPGLVAVAGAAFAGHQRSIGTVLAGITTAARWAVPLYKAWRSYPSAHDNTRRGPGSRLRRT